MCIKPIIKLVNIKENIYEINDIVVRGKMIVR